MTETAELVAAFLGKIAGVAPTVAEVADRTGASPSAVYNALKELGAERVRIAPGTFGYRLPAERRAVREPIAKDSIGTIEGRTWADYFAVTQHFVSQAHLRGEVEASDFARGFQEIANAFQTLSDHARAAEGHADWRIRLGLDTEN